MKTATHAQPGTAGTQPPAMCAAATASAATLTTSSAQYIHPASSPAHGPNARRACSAKDPVTGRAADISPSIRITSTVSTPASAYATRIPGPAAAIPTPDPTNSPAPMAPPNAIMARCRCRSPAPSTSPVTIPPEFQTTSAGA
ncbi:hypothetical protein GCM10010222_11260 [Streptomyces tanashiensis]|nr:hypothetical protein GCM10010222_11260 [Streptomyces tanashiensis]